ncbi:hypothetical protein TSOC_013029 [Tetrabaena socialis]|uniref:Uncharacterized protein n=1 Tax=Tetrabaena socialis TaxID=47790 RepID=A0A2J7ZLG4_9CHLO|nr:hypothetical protein TSOC_013029 [Tetrabaena socialis]|eukprot:PNH01102.1 hypothetical protein TSOC_013029 [Tetrabaena socialis]
MGMAIDVKLTIWDTYMASFDFNMMLTPYTFVIKKWSGNGFAKFGTLFYPHDSADGTVCFSMDTTQKLDMVEQGVRDIIACINKICNHYQSSVVDYAIWYRKMHPKVDTYEQYITREACCALVHVDYIAPHISWEVVQWRRTP